MMSYWIKPAFLWHSALGCSVCISAIVSVLTTYSIPEEKILKYRFHGVKIIIVEQIYMPQYTFTSNCHEQLKLKNIV